VFEHRLLRRVFGPKKRIKLAGTSIENAVRKSSMQLLYYQPTERCDPGRPRRRWLDV
jgi:hypothetical protein